MILLISSVEFIVGLVKNLGCDVDLRGLISRMPEDLEDQSLRDEFEEALQTMFQDYADMVKEM